MPSTVDTIRRRKRLNLLAATDQGKFDKALQEEKKKRKLERELARKKVPGFKKVIKKSFSKLKTLVFN